MTSSLSSRLRLLLESAPLRKVDPQILSEKEDAVLAWQLDVGQELAAENIPFAYVVLVVEGTLRVSGRDSLGNPFTLRRVHAGEWFGLWSALVGTSAATCRTTEATKLLAVPVELWQSWFVQSPDLVEWLEVHPQREDLYVALRPLLTSSARQDRTFLDAIDALQSSLRTVQLRNLEDFNRFEKSDTDISWFLPSISHLLPDLEPYGLEGLSRPTIQRAFESSRHGLRLVGYPIEVLQKLLEPQISADIELNEPDQVQVDPVVEELADWQNPDGEKLLASALSQEQGRSSRDEIGIHVKPIFGHSGVEQGLALLQMICETLRLPFRRDVVDRMLKGMVGSKPVPTLENLGQIADGLGLNAVLMQLPSAHLSRLSLPAVIEIPHQQCLLLVTGASNGRLRVIDPCEGERWIDLQLLEQEQSVSRSVTFSRRPNTPTKRFDISYFFPFLQRFRRSLVLVFVASFFIQIFSLAQPLIIQQIIDKVIGQQNFNTLYFLGVLLIGCSIISNLLNLIRTFLFTDTTNRIDIATSGNILTHLFKLPLGYFDRRPVGEISTRLQELGSIRSFLTGTALTLILDVIFGIIYMFVLISYSGLLTVVSLSVVPLYLALVFIVSPIIKRQLRIAAEANAEASALMVESLTGIQTVKAQHAETILRWRWQQRYARFISSNFRSALIGATSGSIGSFLMK